MKHREFGKLVAILRQDVNMTQFQLAEKSEVDVAVVSQIERGVKRHLDADLLQKLATSLELNLHERQQFYAAAVGLDDAIPLVADDNAPEVKQANQTLDKMMALLGGIRVPGHIVDVYGDVVAANMIIVGLYQVTPETIVESQSIPAGFSSLRLLFGGVLQAVFTEGYDEYLLNSMRSFREFSLRYRALPYSVQIMSELRSKKYPAFERYWRKAGLMEDDKQINLDVFEYSHVQFGLLHYSAVFTVSSTPFGELMLIYNLPMDKHTTEVFEQLAETMGASAFRFAPWPIKPVLPELERN